VGSIQQEEGFCYDSLQLLGDMVGAVGDRDLEGPLLDYCDEGGLILSGPLLRSAPDTETGCAVRPCGSTLEPLDVDEAVGHLGLLPSR